MASAAPAAEVAPVAPVPLRRLTREEYNNAVHDLLGDTSHPGDAFPPDEATSGFESNSLGPVTEPVVQLYMNAAEGLAAAAVKHIETLAPCAPSDAKEECAHRFVDRFGRLAFRRPLEESERATLLTVYTDKAARSDYAGGIQLVLEAILESPQFLYRVEPVPESGAKTSRPLTGYELATRLSFFVWASTPDAELLDLAASGKLSSTAEVESTARRMLADPRAERGIKSFHRQWLNLRELETASKDRLSAQFTPELRKAMVEETLRFAAHAVTSGGDTLKTLFTSHETFVNAPLAKLYGVTAPKEGFALISMPLRQRSGILTQASVMTVLANGDQTSPILRGKFVREKFLCDPIPPPPANVVTTPPKVNPKLTTKERFAQHRTDPSCSSCHQFLDPIGFGFEHYDAIGAWRAKEGKFPVDAVGFIAGIDAEHPDVQFDGALELGEKLAESEQVRRCVATQWLRFALGRSEQKDDEPSIESAYRAFAGAKFDVRELVVAITRTDSFRYAAVEERSGH